MSLRLITVAALLATTLASSLARAVEPEIKAAAEALFDEGKKLRAEGRYLEAAVKFEESQRLDPGVGTLLRLADSYEKAGRLASAWANFRQAESLARSRSDTQRADLAQQRATLLEPKLSKLAIELGDNLDLEGLKVRRDDVVIEPSVANVLVPVDVGIHNVVVTAPGYITHEVSVNVAETDQEKRVSIPALSAAPPPEREPLPTEPKAAPEPEPMVLATSEPSPPVETSSSVTPILTIGLGAAAVVAAGVGTAFMISAISNDNAADEHCDGTVCRDAEGAALSQDAVSDAAVATGGFVAGGALAAAAVVLWLVSDQPSEEGAADGIVIAPALSPERAVVGVGGRF